MNRIDLHMHTTVSDGTDSLAEIISKVREAGIDLFSVTDHDSIRGGIELPDLLSSGDPSFIRGIEFSCKDDEGKYHILGYGYDPKGPDIEKVFRKGHGYRIEKTKARLDFLREHFGFEFPEDEIEELMSRDNPGKPHIAGMMVRHGYADSISQAISEYIDQKKFGNVYVTPEEAIEGIRKSNGIPVLAHPAYGNGDDLILGEELDARFRKLIDMGLEGTEAYYSGFTPRIQEEALELARKYDLYVTAGSDYHGTNKMVDLGWTNLGDISDAPPGMMRFLEIVEIIEGGRSESKGD